ncbi:FAD-linked oxidoreductase patO [Colletotrichum siamense]|uniref:FAD-linked oxidoreductase patO n=1 Tax=Colletotrichum siamense TaxID=690259 RepID=A0A9P5EMG8_COLSI|nr:FAD-linked oxidoreductase patO [Colletotrichum siamense]
MLSIAKVFVATFALTGGSLANTCKCPSLSEWESFNQTISGKLIRTVPLASVCYKSEPNYNEDSCNIVLSNWATWELHSSDPASVPSSPSLKGCEPIYSNGTSINGDPDAGSKGCSSGSLPPYVVNATDSGDIQRALAFAKDRNLRLAIKNTGHNGSGRNLGFGSLSIWTHNMKQTQFHDQFKSLSCPANSTWKGSQMAITIGAGIQDGELYDFAQKHNVVAVGGTNMDVGVVGWATGGGHGHLTGEYGMGADSILEASVVTPNGDLVTVNACQNEDIYWAIRGGGGGTFGVIVNMTVKAYPVPDMILLGLNVSANNGTSTKSWWKFVAKLHTLLPALQDQGIKGYYTIAGPPSSATVGMSGSLFAWNMSNDTVAKSVAPIRQLISNSSGIVSGSVQVVPIPSFYALLTGIKIPDHAGGSGITAARLISRKTVTENEDLLAEVLEQVGPQAIAPIDGTPNPSMSGTMTISQVPVDNALNPAWRDSVVHLITSQSWTDSTPNTTVSTLVNQMTYNKLNALRELNPETGIYLNEANAIEPGWQWSFFGPNYGRLRSIKENG